MSSDRLNPPNHILAGNLMNGNVNANNMAGGMESMQQHVEDPRTQVFVVDDSLSDVAKVKRYILSSVSLPLSPCRIARPRGPLIFSLAQSAASGIHQAVGQYGTGRTVASCSL